MEKKDGKFYLKNIELTQQGDSRRQPIEIAEMRNKVIDALIDYLKVRMGMEGQNEDLMKTINSFLKFEKEYDINTIHGSIGKDLDLAQLHLQYVDLSNSAEEIKSQPLQILLKYLLEPSRVEYFDEIATLIARICACTPHSADCERVISANNNLKTNKRSNLTISTENSYLYVHFNMPTLDKWDVRNAVERYLSEKNRRQSNKTIAHQTTTNQRWFNHIFEKACVVDENNRSMKFTF